MVETLSHPHSRRLLYRPDRDIHQSLLNLFPEGILQFLNVLNNGYWHARNVAFQEQLIVHFLEWLRLPADLIFIFLGVLPLLIGTVFSYVSMRRQRT